MVKPMDGYHLLIWPWGCSKSAVHEHCFAASQGFQISPCSKDAHPPVIVKVLKEGLPAKCSLSIDVDIFN
jgi:hypothetical protein